MIDNDALPFPVEEPQEKGSNKTCRKFDGDTEVECPLHEKPSHNCYWWRARWGKPPPDTPDYWQPPKPISFK